MKYLKTKITLTAMLFATLSAHSQDQVRSATVPFTLDHNRMLVEAEIQREDGTWRKALLWVDTGNPTFMLSKELAVDLGVAADTISMTQEVEPPNEVRIGGMKLEFGGVTTSVSPEIRWLYNTMHNDGNLPATVLKNYHVIFDYPARKLTIAEPGILTPRGIPSPAHVKKSTGIVQVDAVIDGKKFSFALDNGSSFSYVSDSLLRSFLTDHPEWPHSTGAVGCANIWGWWPQESTWPLLQVDTIRWGNTIFTNYVLAGLPNIFRGKADVGKWYSRKSARPVQGFFGPNIFGDYRVEILYGDSTVYFEKGNTARKPEMELVGLTIKPLNDGQYVVIGISSAAGENPVAGVQPGDLLISVDKFLVSGATMGSVVDALRGKPGDKKVLVVERQGKEITVEATVQKIL